MLFVTCTLIGYDLINVIVLLVCPESPSSGTQATQLMGNDMQTLSAPKRVPQEIIGQCIAEVRLLTEQQ
jgi:hypothetical protein